MTRHGFVTRDSRVASHGVSQCPDPTRPDPTHLVGFACIVSTGSATSNARGRLVPADACTEINGGQ